MTTTDSSSEAPVRMLTRAEWLGLLDREAQRELGVSGEEFTRKWHAGEYGDPDDDPRVLRVALLLPDGW